MLPVGKMSKCRKRTRRAHHARVPAALVVCPKCGKAKLPHCACPSCGFVSAKLMLPLPDEEG
ncbi:MAG: 50S ribosomal protein L32 [Planctomycetota bacterium]